MGPQPVPHVVPATFLLHALNGLLTSSAVLMQPLWLSGDIPRPQYPFQRAAKRPDEPHPLPVALVPLPLRTEGGKSPAGCITCAGAPPTAAVAASCADTL